MYLTEEERADEGHQGFMVQQVMLQIALVQHLHLCVILCILVVASVL